jgi:hypothetical protein
MFTISIIDYSVNKLESQWGWSSHVTLRYLQLDLIVRFTLLQDQQDFRQHTPTVRRADHHNVTSFDHLLSAFYFPSQPNELLLRYRHSRNRRQGPIVRQMHGNDQKNKFNLLWGMDRYLVDECRMTKILILYLLVMEIWPF